LTVSSNAMTPPPALTAARFGATREYS
jgi:hypothetical protein